MLIGNKVIILPSCHSTNQFLKEKMKNDCVSGEVVCAKIQSSGRGQRGNVWESEPNQNLTFSFYLEPFLLDIKHQFSLNYFVSLAIYDFLEEFLPNKSLLQLKWPNDIYYNNKKIGGVLIENQVKDSFVANTIVGIGLNINQLKFNLPRATSLAIETNEKYEIEEALGFLLRSLNKRYLSFSLGDVHILKSDYLTKLMGFKKIRSYQDNITGDFFLGEIIGVKDTGELVISNSNGGVLEYGLKEITFLFD